MKKIILGMLLIGSTNTFANQTFDGNYTISYDCGFVSGFGLMVAEPEYQGIDKIFAPKVTVTVGEAKLENPSYTIQMSHRNEHNQTCTVAGAGEDNEFHWYISKNDCKKIVAQPLSKDSFSECGVNIELKK